MRSRVLSVVVLLFASFMDLIDTTIVNVALPSIQKDLGASSSNLEWIVSGYILAFAVLLIIGGRLGDIFGRKRVFLIGVAGFTLSSLAASLAANGDILVATRVIQGLFAAMMVPQVLAIIQALFAPKERAAIFGVTGAISGLAAVAGPLLGGILVTGNLWGMEWRSIFLINVPIGVLLIIATFLFVPETKSENPLRLDLLGVVLATAGLVLMVYPLVEGRQLDWPAWIWVMLVASPVVLGVFVWQQRRRQAKDGSALLPMSLFAARGFSAGILTQFTFQAAIGSFFLILVIYLQTGLGFSAIGAALATLPYSVGAFVGSGISVPLAAKLGKVLIFAGAAMQAAAVVWVGAIIAQEGTGLAGIELFWPMAIAGVGLGLEVVPLVDVALSNIPVKDAGAASGALGTFQQIGAALGVAVIGVVFFGVIGTQYTPEVLKTAFLDARWVAVIALALSALSALLLPRLADVKRHKEEEAALLEERELVVSER